MSSTVRFADSCFSRSSASLRALRCSCHCRKTPMIGASGTFQTGSFTRYGGRSSPPYPLCPSLREAGWLGPYSRNVLVGKSQTMLRGIRSPVCRSEKSAPFCRSRKNGPTSRGFQRGSAPFGGGLGGTPRKPPLGGWAGQEPCVFHPLGRSDHVGAWTIPRSPLPLCRSEDTATKNLRRGPPPLP